MKSFAEVKRRIVVGTLLRIVNHSPDLTHLKAIVGEPRKVGIVQGNAIAFEDPAKPGVRGAMSWVYWPKASQIAVMDDRFTVTPDHGRWITYEFA